MTDNATISDIADKLTADARTMILQADGDEYIGFWVGNGAAVWKVAGAGLTDNRPRNTGGSWGDVAPLNDTGLSVRAYLQEKQP